MRALKERRLYAIKPGVFSSPKNREVFSPDLSLKGTFSGLKIEQLTHLLGINLVLWRVILSLLI